jgi:hypothetical protein
MNRLCRPAHGEKRTLAGGGTRPLRAKGAAVSLPSAG